MSSDSSSHPRLRAGSVGVLAVIGGLAAGHLTASLVAPDASPALAVGGRVIDLTPTPVKEWAVATFGTMDKPLLIGGVLAITLALGAAIGLAALRHRWAIWAGPATLTAVAVASAALAPVPGPFAVVPALVTGAIGIAVLAWFMRRTARVREHTGRVYALNRRAFLTGTAVTGVGSAAAFLGGQYLATQGRVPSTVTLPAPVRTVPPLPAGLDVPGIAPWVTPNADFYRVDINLIVPNVDVNGWTLTVDGMVDRPFTLTWPELLALPMVEKDITLNCVSNEVGGPYIGGARWLGVPMKDLLARAGVQAGAEQVLSRSVDGLTISTPVQALTDDRGAMLAVGMNGQPLSAERGFPARMLTPGLYGYVGATKWLTRLTLTTWAGERAYWTQRDWAEQAPVKPSSRIDTPRPFARPKPGKVMVAGVAWAQHIGVKGVQVRVDGGPWRDADLGPDAGIDYWRQWSYAWPATSGQHTLESRVIDRTGASQREARATPFPDGSSGLHSVVVIVD